MACLEGHFDLSLHSGAVWSAYTLHFMLTFVFNNMSGLTFIFDTTPACISAILSEIYGPLGRIGSNP
jgi:hypothetical protein